MIENIEHKHANNSLFGPHIGAHNTFHELQTVVSGRHPLPKEIRIVRISSIVAYPLRAGRMAYVHVARGCVNVNGVPLSAGDAAHVKGEALAHLSNAEAAEVLLFDLPN